MNQKKIGIITIHKVNNYGAELQAFALQEKLVRLGFNAEIIDYLYYKHKDFRFTKKAKPFVNLGFKKYIKERMYPLLTKVKSIPYRNALKIREAKFQKFHEKYTRYSKNCFDSIESLYQSEMDYDLYMVGSDQVWNPYSKVSLKPYFLDFAPANKIRVSYASSFGVATIPDEAKTIYRDCLNEFNSIAVREEQGVKIILELTGHRATHVVDPTLLLDMNEWREFAADVNVKKPYLLLYELTTSPFTTQLASRIAESLKLKVVSVSNTAVKQDHGNSIQNIVDIGPSEFIGLFQKAAFVITNSFHGTAFSINFKKPFYTVLPKHKANNSRQKGLLESLKLNDRIVNEGEELPAIEYYIPDYSEAEETLQQQRKKSIDYLFEAINGENDESHCVV